MDPQAGAQVPLAKMQTELPGHWLWSLQPEGPVDVVVLLVEPLVVVVVVVVSPPLPPAPSTTASPPQPSSSSANQGSFAFTVRV